MNSSTECCLSVVGEACHWMPCWDRWLHSDLLYFSVQQKSQTSRGCSFV